MKKMAFIVCCLMAWAFVVQAQYVNIPDSNFRKYLITQIPACFNADGQMDTTCSGVTDMTEIICRSAAIRDLTGIEYFKSLTYLDCANNSLQVLPQLPNSLESLSCYENKLQVLPQLPEGLQGLWCGTNSLQVLPQLPSRLETLFCMSNSLQVLPSLPDSLKYLYCGVNPLQVLPSLPNGLKELNCSYSQLQVLPSLPDSLTSLFCNDNQLQVLPSLPDSLKYLGCGANQLQVLPSLPIGLKVLWCSGNQLKVLPSLPNRLESLTCSSNQLFVLPSLDSLTNLQTLDCSDNPNLNCLPKLPSSLTKLYVSNTGIRCIPNSTATTVDPANLPFCNPTNNANHCIAFPTIYGKVFGDDNLNGRKDPDEYYIPYVPVRIKGGEIAYSNLDGEYELTTYDTGYFSLMAVPPPYYKAVPDSMGVSFSAYRSVLTLPDIALQPTERVRGLALDIYNWQPAIPGRSLVYSLACQNTGTVNEAIKAVFNYDTTMLKFEKASVPNVVVKNGTITWYDTLMPNYFNRFKQWSDIPYPKLYFTVSTKAQMGDTVYCSAMIASSADTATAERTLYVRTSYDPNSKEATEQLSITQVADGKGIDYRINFQNLGNASAKDIVIADTLSPLIAQGILEIKAMSHKGDIILNNNILYFQFRDIYLIDSATNEPMSHGFVHFKVTPLANVSVGTVIDNKASIYFDYNPPVVTNIASTTIKNIVLPVSISSYQLTETHQHFIENSWVTASETNTAYFNVQRSINGSSFSTIGKVAAKGKGSSYLFTDATVQQMLWHAGTVYYRLEIVDKNGQISYSATKSINLASNQQRVSIYPNPAKDFIVVNGTGIVGVRIVDGSGRAVMADKPLDGAMTHQKIHLKLPAGMYTVKLQLASGIVINKKLLVEAGLVN